VYQAYCLWHNFNKVKVVWGNLSRPLAGTGVSPKIQVYFYKCVTGQTALFASESWNVKAQMEAALNHVQVKAARKMTGMKAYLQNGEWFWPSKTEALKLAGLHPISTYIQHRQATIFPWVQFTLHASKNPWHARKPNPDVLDGGPS
jgi:hypothetical protein